ncbi:MAG: ribosome-binding factor A [Betaproteobacteria bacterium RBG_19FT_COMBO_58_11]|nr:MAG: ribosome-binding factor A [Betaproteobacteria bacterium RBG_19FT_COMBO_58_11]
MPKDASRPRRVAEQIQRELAELIQLELKDPRVGMVTLTGVEVSADYAHAKVFFSLLGDQARVNEAIKGLNSAAGFLRSQVAHRMKLRVMPMLHFMHDISIEQGARLDKLIADAVAEDARHPSDD